VWLSDAQPEKALAAARSALHGTTGIARIEALLFRAQLHLGLGQNQEALEVFEQIQVLNKDNILSPRWDVWARVDAGFALAQLRLQKTEAVTAALTEASGFEHATGIKPASQPLEGRSRELSPIYSTP
jgi:hypothetical protein